MNFLRIHLLPGSFRSSYADTDSMCLGVSRTQPIPEDATPEQYYRCLFDPLVRPDKKDSWESQWRSWFVTTDDIEDQREPGKLKSTFFIVYEYYTICRILTETLRGIWNIKGTLCRLITKMLLHIRCQFRRDQEGNEGCTA